MESSRRSGALFALLIITWMLLCCCSGEAESLLTEATGGNVTLSRSERDLSWFTSWLPWRRQDPGTTTVAPTDSRDRQGKCEWSIWSS